MASLDKKYDLLITNEFLWYALCYSSAFLVSEINELRLGVGLEVSPHFPLFGNGNYTVNYKAIGMIKIKSTF